MISFTTLVSHEYVLFVVILVSTFFVATLFRFLIRTYFRKLARLSVTDLDDMILDILTQPLFAIVLLLGTYGALRSLSIMEPATAWLNGILFVALVFLITRVVVHIVRVLTLRGLNHNQKSAKTPQLISKVIAVVLYLMAGAMILSYFEIEITPLVATLGLGGLAVGLALQATLSNFFAGLHIISDKPVSLGDFVELPDAHISGVVEDIGWRSTRIRTLPNQIIVIPNAKLAESIIVNDSLPEHEMAALVQCGVAYGSDLTKVERVTIEVAKHIQTTVAGTVASFDPFIRYHTFGDSNINFTVILRVQKFVDKYLVIHEFIKALKARYDTEGIEISWPVRKIYTQK